MSNKARNLEILDRYGIPTPQGFTIPAEHYRAAVAPVVEEIVTALPASGRIQQILLRTGINSHSIRFLDSNLSNLVGDEFAVRSSGAVAAQGRAIHEDSEHISLAGQFESFLNVPRHEVPNAVIRCWASLFNDRSVRAFNADRQYVLESEMSVVVQEMVPAKASAVMMTVDPQGTGDTGAIEFTWGPCEAIVAGMVSPDEAVFDRATGAILRTLVGLKECAVSYGAFQASGCNVRRIPTSTASRLTLSLDDAVLRKIIGYGQSIEKIFGKPQDVEAVVTPDNRIIITQSRPVTRVPALTIPFSAALAA